MIILAALTGMLAISAMLEASRFDKLPSARFVDGLFSVLLFALALLWLHVGGLL